MKSLHGPIAILLTCSFCLPVPLSLAQDAATPSTPTSTGLRPSYNSAQLRNDARILHALNRFTFGPRPGDLEAVRQIGLEAWFDQQLHPATLDDSDLDARLAQYPAIQWTPDQLLYRMPSNAVIRQVADGKFPMPATGTLHSVYANQLYRIQLRKQQAEKQQAAAASQLGQPQPDAISAPPAANPPAMNGATAMNMDATATAPSAAPNMDAATGPNAPQAAMQPDPAAASQPDPALIQTILSLSPTDRVLRLQSMPPADFEAFIKSLKGPQRQALLANLTPDLRESIEDLENPDQTVVQELFAQRLAHDIYSSAQLQQVMTDFWLNHFNIYLRKDEQMPYYLVSYERDVIRPHALGRFEDLLEAVAHSPAMLLYLDNAQSMGPDSPAAERAKMNAFRNPNAKKSDAGINENYARELMELHTLGVNGGYTQADVIQVARVLTGWGVDRPQFGGAFQFNPNRHEPGTKTVMGTKIKDQGELEGVQLLHFLATRPATAQFLSRELAIRFVSDNPPQPLVDRMARTYLSTNGDIPSVLRTLFHSPEFWSASAYRAKIKTPLEFVVSAARASNADVSNYQPLVNALRQMGMPLYGCVPPTGYKWDEADWVSTGALVDRMNFALQLAANRFPGITVDWAPAADLSVLDSDAPATQIIPTPESEESRLEPLIVPSGVSVATRSAALQLFAQQNAATRPGAPADVSSSVGLAHDYPPAAARPVDSTDAVARRVNPNYREPNRPNRAPAPDKYQREDQQLAGLLIGSPEFQRR
jgi:uncharacterized protein (DUF1800 family)